MKSNVQLHVTIKGIIIKENKVLLLKRSRPSSDGLGEWELPGGGLEYGESPTKTLLREVKEETGLDIMILKPTYTFTAIRDHYQTIGIGFLCTTNQEHVVISKEHVDYQFVSFDKIKNYLCDEIYQDVLHSIQEYQKR